MTVLRNITGWLPNLLGPVDFLVNGVPTSVPRRGAINIIGGTVTDNPEADRTDITIGGGTTKRGRKVIVLAEEESVALVEADLLNPSYSGARYEGLIVSGTGGEDPVAIVLPQP